MASFTNYAVQQIHLEMKDGTGTIPTTYYAAAMKVMPGLDGTGGTEIDLAVDTWYARQAVTFATPSLAGRSMASSAEIVWTSSSLTAVSGNIVGVVLYSAVTAGNAWLLLPATNQIAVGIGSPLKAAIGQLVSEFTTT
jgi:hypothetical protein